MYLDSSAILALLFDEPEAESLAARIERAATPLITSPVSLFEAALTYARIQKTVLAEAEAILDEFLKAGDIAIRDVTKEVGRHAMAAYARYGRGSGHGARLNMGDAFSYGCARHYGVPLLYKGNDFSQTDLG